MTPMLDFADAAAAHPLPFRFRPHPCHYAAAVFSSDFFSPIFGSYHSEEGGQPPPAAH
eukprot:CAMPEP_0113578602 /NCGR_PEP_ID=MMETSP0015_2-20120614/29582_1 /TAXON_ID=2838 /ORGANISM="Odontella" /LENGTH=57 /DNA_ID=CAMNT_0000482445 /DNA_START=9 /DNA_END=182 /DNA_ORIENTATION=+ /assembly_acc=CAM_ASM_000160